MLGIWRLGIGHPVIGELGGMGVIKKSFKQVFYDLPRCPAS